jgi:hypothetical protein
MYRTRTLLLPAVTLALAGMFAGYLAARDAGKGLLAEILAQHSGSQTSYTKMLQTITAIDAASPRVSAVSIGRSVRGRHIALVAVHDSGTVFGQTKRVMVICRQHGDEEAPTEAMLALIRHLAFTQGEPERALLRRVTLIIIPMVNPDAAESGGRRNARGVDLNRNWQTLSEPETRAVEAAFLQWRPDVFIDCHELPRSSSKPAYQTNFVQAIGPCSAVPEVVGKTSMLLGGTISYMMRQYGIPLNTYFDDASKNRALAHRHFGFDHDTPSYLFESKSGWSIKDRMKLHIIGVLVAANQLAQQAPAPAETQFAWVAPPRAQEPGGVMYEMPTKVEVKILSPARGAVVSRPTEITTSVLAGAGFSYVMFSVDGRVKTLSNCEPYSYLLDPAQYEPGTHTILVEAMDAHGTTLSRTETSIIVPPGLQPPQAQDDLEDSGR